MSETTSNPALRYLIRFVPSEGPLRCDVCGGEILTPEEISAAHDSTADLRWILEVVVIDHLRVEHSRIFAAPPEIVFTLTADEISSDFPDQEIARNNAHADHKEAPPRSPDERNAKS